MSSRRSRSGGSAIGKHAEPVVEVRAEARRAVDRLAEIAVGRGDDAHVDGDASCWPPTGAHLALLRATRSSFACMPSGDLADLVEEERAAVGLLEEAAPRPIGAGERAALVAEELALEQRLGERGAVHAPRTARGARGRVRWIARATSSLPVPLSPTSSTVTADRAARAASSNTASRPLLSEKMPSSRKRSRMAAVAPPSPRRARAALLAVGRRSRARRPSASRTTQGHAAEIAPFLHDVVGGAELHGVDGHVLRSSAGDDDDRDRRMPGTDDPEAVEAGGVREAVVEQDAVDPSGGQMLERLPDRGHRDDLESSGRRERSSDQLRGLGVVLNEEDRRRHGGGLSRIR